MRKLYERKIGLSFWGANKVRAKFMFQDTSGKTQTLYRLSCLNVLMPRKVNDRYLLDLWEVEQICKSNARKIEISMRFRSLGFKPPHGLHPQDQRRKQIDEVIALFKDGRLRRPTRSEFKVFTCFSEEDLKNPAIAEALEQTPGLLSSCNNFFAAEISASGDLEIAQHGQLMLQGLPYFLLDYILLDGGSISIFKTPGAVVTFSFKRSPTPQREEVVDADLNPPLLKIDMLEFRQKS